MSKCRFCGVTVYGSSGCCIGCSRERTQKCPVCISECGRLRNEFKWRRKGGQGVPPKHCTKCGDTRWVFLEELKK